MMLTAISTKLIRRVTRDAALNMPTSAVVPHTPNANVAIQFMAMLMEVAHRSGILLSNSVRRSNAPRTGLSIGVTRCHHHQAAAALRTDPIAYAQIAPRGPNPGPRSHSTRRAKPEPLTADRSVDARMRLRPCNIDESSVHSAVGATARVIQRIDGASSGLWKSLSARSGAARNSSTLVPSEATSEIDIAAR